MVRVRDGPRRCPSRRAGVLSAFHSDCLGGGGGGKAPFPGLVINRGLRASNPCAAVGVDQISKGQRGMLSIGAPGRFLNVKPDTGGGKTGGRGAGRS